METTTTSNVTSELSLYERYNNDWFKILRIHRPDANNIDRSLTPIFYFIGIVGNALSARIWLERRMRMNNSSAIYLATLSITDLIFLFLHIPMELKYAWNVQTLDYPVLCETFFLFYNVGQYLSPILVLAFTVERYIAVCHPFQKEQYCTTSRAIKVVIFLVTFCMSLSCIQAYFWSYNPKTMQCQVRDEVQVGGDHSLWSAWIWASEIVTFVLVPFVILVFNILVLREVRKLSQSGRSMLPGQPVQGSSASSATTVMLLSVSFYVIITTIPASVVYSMHYMYDQGNINMTDDEMRLDPTWQSYFTFVLVRKIVEEICLSHYACNIVLYVITGTQFRKTLLDMLKVKSLAGAGRSQMYNTECRVEFSQIPK